MTTAAQALAYNDGVSRRDLNSAPIVDISVGSRFHAFDLARELHAHGMLRVLHTGYPAFSAPRFGVPRSHVRSVWTGEPLNRALWRLHQWGLVGRYDPLVCQRHDRIVASRLRPGADIFVGWSSQCRLTLSVARRLGMTTVVERGSSHIQWQRRQLAMEQSLTGIDTDIPDSRTVDLEIAEYEAADYISVPSRFAAATFSEFGVPARKLLVNPYGVDVRRFSPARRSGRSAATLKVLHVGQISPRKGISYLIEAVNSVPGARLTLVGPMLPGMRTFIDSKPSVKAVGPVPGGDLWRWYSEADVFCLLSVEEGLALVIAQAMAMGLPVIATPNTGAEELIDDGESGFIVAARDPVAAGDRLRKLAADPELRERMGERARARVLAGFRWRDYGERAVALYRRITSTH